MKPEIHETREQSRQYRSWRQIALFPALDMIKKLIDSHIRNPSGTLLSYSSYAFRLFSFPNHYLSDGMESVSTTGNAAYAEKLRQAKEVLPGIESSLQSLSQSSEDILA